MPAALFIALASVSATRAGWGVPMATDIAFAVGILTLLGKRVSVALRVLLLAVAVIDDLGAIVVIALFYSSGLDGFGLLLAAAGFLSILGMQRFGVRAKLAYDRRRDRGLVDTRTRLVRHRGVLARVRDELRRCERAPKTSRRMSWPARCAASMSPGARLCHPPRV